MDTVLTITLVYNEYKRKIGLKIWKVRASVKNFVYENEEL